MKICINPVHPANDVPAVVHIVVGPDQKTAGYEGLSYCSLGCMAADFATDFPIDSPAPAEALEGEG